MNFERAPQSGALIGHIGILGGKPSTTGEIRIDGEQWQFEPDGGRRDQEVNEGHGGAVSPSIFSELAAYGRYIGIDGSGGHATEKRLDARAR